MMRLPSLMKKPKYQRFHVEPRYYDPIKEDIEVRTQRIKSEMGLKGDAFDAGYHSKISGSFRKSMKHAKSSGDYQTMTLRLVILIVLVLFAGGFIYIGTEVFYLLLLYIPFYLWRKFRK